jgi:uncharacterized repeat protein (TIGR03803 family)
MRNLGFSRHALTSCAAAAMLAACGGSQPPIGAPGAMPQSRASSSYGYNTLYSFGTSYDGQQPKAGLIDLNGVLYGTTYGGGTYGAGTVFSMTTTGTEKVLHNFQGGRDGANPSASLVAVKGLLYGTTEYGGLTADPSNGTVFRVSTTGSEKVLYRFYGYYYQGKTYSDGANPVASLVDVKDKLYGTTLTGGFNELYGTVFRISTAGREKVLHSFAGYFDDGESPTASLLDVNGTLYGTTHYGGQVSGFGYGTVFALNTNGSQERVTYKFSSSSSGDYPLASLIEIDNMLYGTAAGGGVSGGGTAFKTGTGGGISVLHGFGSGSDGSGPFAPLLRVRSKLYGTTAGGGAYGKGTVFSMSLSGSEKVLHSFGYGSDGATPLAGLINVNGTLYGTTSAGGTYGDGTVFALKP